MVNNWLGINDIIKGVLHLQVLGMTIWTLPKQGKFRQKLRLRVRFMAAEPCAETLNWCGAKHSEDSGHHGRELDQSI